MQLAAKKLLENSILVQLGEMQKRFVQRDIIKKLHFLNNIFLHPFRIKWKLCFNFNTHQVIRFSQVFTSFGGIQRILAVVGIFCLLGIYLCPHYCYRQHEQGHWQDPEQLNRRCFVPRHSCKQCLQQDPGHKGQHKHLNWYFWVPKYSCMHMHYLRQDLVHRHWHLYSHKHMH